MKVQKLKVTEVFDNGRRGEPLAGCDCMRCFGYCVVDKNAATREKALTEEVTKPEQPIDAKAA